MTLRPTTLLLLGGIALSLTGCLRTLHHITTTQWDPAGRAQYYVGYWEGQCLGTGLCFSTSGQLLMCRLNEDNSMACSPQGSVADALKAKQK